MKYKLLSPKEYAAKYSVNERTVRVLCANGGILAGKIGKSWRLPDILILNLKAGEQIQAGDALVLGGDGLVYKLKRQNNE